MHICRTELMELDIEELEPLYQDALRYRWITEDHADPETRDKCRDILKRLPLMSYSAASSAIDNAMETPNAGIQTSERSEDRLE